MDKQRRIERVREALANGRVSAVEFHKDGSGASFEYLDPVGDHGCPCTMASSFKIEEALEIISGFRFKQHELKTCM
ncbi:MAG: hypothetical protein IKL37_04510 [Alphaproteobacteria bacterium]|nr:hypothetical protein [Alphaproteobacteria bacterium]